MTNGEKWTAIVNEIERLSDELHDLFDSLESQKDETDTALMGLRMTIEDLNDQEIDD